MMCNDDFDTSNGFRFGKISVSCSVHFYSLYLPNGKNRGKSEKIENLSLSMLIIYKNVPSVQIWYR